MTIEIKPRRSALYMPCSNARALDKAQQLDCDVILFDLEDAVSPENKAIAREQIVTALSENDYGRRGKVVRINALEHHWGFDDVNALKNSDFDALLIPKVETVQQINEVLAVFGGDITIWCMIETPMGVMNVKDIAGHEKVDVLVMGTNDLAKELRVEQSDSREEFSYAFGACIMAARSYQCDILDGVYNQLDNADGFKTICEHGEGLGFDGKTLIHPKQLDACNAVFSPSVESIEFANKIIQAWENTEDKGVLVVNGRLVEELHVIEAKRTLAMQEAIVS